MIPTIAGSPVPSKGDSHAAEAPRCPSARWKAMPWVLTTTVLVLVGLTSVTVVGIQWFGSTASALAYLRGDRLVPDAYSKSFGTATKDERPSVKFLLRNCTGQPIKILGVTQSCTCMATSDLPMVISPHGVGVLTVNSRAKGVPGPYSEWLRVFTDSGRSNFVLGVQGTFR